MERYKYDAVSRTLVMSAGFDRALNDYNSDESRLYRRMLKEIPDLVVDRKSHASPTSYKGKNGKRTSYYPTKGLTFERMEQFMKALPEGEKYLEEYNQLRAVALPELCPSRYTIIRRWFEAQFPKYRDNPLFYVKNSVEVIDYATFLDNVA